MKTIKFLCAIALVVSSITETFAQTTKLIVRARAKDAKFIGSKHAKAYGNVLVKVTDALTGAVLAEGATTGESGDTKLLLQTPLNRYQRLTDDSTARFEALLTIKEPTLVTVSAAVPSNKKNAKESFKTGFKYQTKDAILATVQTWVIPGKHIDEEGLILEIPGLVVDIQKPADVIQLSSLTDGKLTIKNHLALQCGCVITSGGLWNADPIEVKGVIKRNGIRLQETTFKITGPSIFEGTFSNITQKGNYEVQVFAYDSVTKNTGAETISFEVK